MSEPKASPVGDGLGQLRAQLQRAIKPNQPKRPHLIRVVGRTLDGQKRQIVIDRSRRYGGEKRT